MKKQILMAAALLAAPGLASAQIVISNPTIDLALSNAEIVAGTGGGAWGHRAMGVAADGDLVLCATGGSTSGMWRVDMTGAPAFTQIATTAELLAALTGHATVDCNGVAVAADDTIYASFFVGTDTVLEIVPGAPPTITSRFAQDGIGTIRLSLDESDVYVSQVQSFGAPANAISVFPAAGGAASSYVSVADVTAVTAAANASFGPMDVDAVGDLVFFDELSFGGSDSLLRRPEAGAVTGILAVGDFPAGPGVNSLAVDDLGNIFMFDEFGTGFSDSVLILSEDGTTFHRILKAQIDAATGLSNYELKTLHAYTAATDSVIVYGSDDESDGVISFAFGAAPAAAVEWTMHE